MPPAASLASLAVDTDPESHWRPCRADEKAGTVADEMATVVDVKADTAAELYAPATVTDNKATLDAKVVTAAADEKATIVAELNAPATVVHAFDEDTMAQLSEALRLGALNAVSLCGVVPADVK